MKLDNETTDLNGYVYNDEDIRYTNSTQNLSYYISESYEDIPTEGA
jgi:hypothetical protein